MRTPRVYKTEAVVLRHRKLGEADKILTLYTPNQGKLEAVAKGVRRPKSRKSGHVEELCHTSLLIARGRNLDIVTQSEALENFPSLREDLGRLTRALYIAELVDRFSSEGVENYPLYALLLETLRNLAERDELDLISRYFEVRLLQHVGYQLQLKVCTACRAELGPVINYFSPVAGGVICSACRQVDTSPRPISVNALKVLRLMQSTGFTSVARVRLTHALAAEIEEHLRVYIRYTLEHELRSLDFLRTVRRGDEAQRAAALAVADGVVSYD